MPDNHSEWDDWLVAELVRDSQENAKNRWFLGYELYKQADYRRAADMFKQAAEAARGQDDVILYCDSLLWEGYCYSLLSEYKTALARLLKAEQLEGGAEKTRFNILSELFDVVNKLPLSIAKQRELLCKLTPYKATAQLGSSKSIVLQWEGRLFSQRGDYQSALNCAQEALVCSRSIAPSYNDCYYYRALVRLYCENQLIDDAWSTLRTWRAIGSTNFAKVTSWQCRAEAQIRYTEGQLSAAWDSICLCKAEEEYLQIYGVEDTETLIWQIRIAVDAGRIPEAREAIVAIFRFRNSDSLYDQYDCFYWIAYYYAALWRNLLAGGSGTSRYEKENIARARAERWFARAEQAGRELDGLLETDVKHKELNALREILKVECHE